MKARVQMWGNSLALLIPRAFAQEAKLGQDTEVDLSLQDGAIVIQPLSTQPYSLDELREQITDENRHTEVDLGLPLGALVGEAGA